MTTIHVSFPVLLTLLRASYCSICQLHSFHQKFYTDLNYMVREKGSSLWYVVAYQQPDLPELTLYHLPPDIETNRDCYSYILSTSFGVLMLDFSCVGNGTLHSYDLLTRPDGVYVTSKKYPRPLSDFRTVNVLRLTKEMVLLISCSAAVDTYGLLVLHRGPIPARDEAYFQYIISAKFPNDLYRWMNFTVTSMSDGEPHCNCSNKFTVPIETIGTGEGIGHDKRKMFVLFALTAAITITAIVKILKRFF